MFDKKLTEVTVADLQGLIDKGIVEDERVEYKRALPTNSGADHWNGGAKEIGVKARDELLSEVVAFANAGGGCVVLGVEETPDKPPKAHRIHPLPRCAELAEKLALQARECIDPKLPVIHTHGLPTAQDGSGVVLVRVEASRMRPHRLNGTKECYVRRADRSERMTMREIRDMTLLAYYESQRLEDNFRTKRSEFRRRMRKIAKPAGFIGVRLTAIPVGADLEVARVHKVPELTPMSGDLPVSIEGTEPQPLHYPARSLEFRPSVRATLGTSKSGDSTMRTELHCDGTFHTEYVHWDEGHQHFGLYLNHVLALVLNGFRTCEQFRVFAGARDVAYAAELHLFNTFERLSVFNVGTHPFYGGGGILEAGDIVFPRYSFGPIEDLDALATGLLTDLRDAAGMARSSEWSVAVK